MKAFTILLLCALSLPRCIAAPSLLRVAIGDLSSYCAPALLNEPTPKYEGKWLVWRRATLMIDALDRSFTVLDAFRVAARHHEKRGMSEKAEEYRKRAITQLQDFEAQLVAAEKCEAFGELELDASKLRRLFSRIRVDASAYASLLGGGKFPEEEPNQTPEPTAPSGRGSS